MSRTDGLYNAVERRIINEMLRLASGGDKKKLVRAFQLAEKITPEAYKGAVRFVREKIEVDHPALGLAQRVAVSLHPTCRDRFIEALIVNTLLRGVAKRKELMARTGMWAPTTILMSPTMRCNLACEGCYAAEYSDQAELGPDLLQRIVDEGNEMGVYLFTLLGGEPFIYSGLLDLARANPDSYFQIFTNGTLINERVIREMTEIGNVLPVLSVEGTRELTDERRGPGMYDRITRVMDALGEAGVPFGYSATVTRENWQTLVSDEFVDPLVARGAMIGWHFLYMPLGRNPNVDLMPTPAQREEFRLGILRLRSSKAYFPVDFWGDAPFVGGCIAGKHYMHINSEGWVEPCIFTHFATDNIRDKSLLEAFNSPFFQAMRERQPFNENLLLPCMWIDNPQFSREIMAVTGAQPTHEGADVMITELQGDMDRYAAEAARVFHPVWHAREAEKQAKKPGEETPEKSGEQTVEAEGISARDEYEPAETRSH